MPPAGCSLHRSDLDFRHQFGPREAADAAIVDKTVQAFKAIDPPCIIPEHCKRCDIDLLVPVVVASLGWSTRREPDSGPGRSTSA
jgi:hypothetical protein